MTTYNKLRQILTDRLLHRFIQTESPEDLYDSCGGNIDDAYQIGYNEGEIDAQNVLTLQDILLAIDIKNKGLETGYRTLGGGLDFQADMGLTYNLNLPLSQQSDETLLEIIKLIE